MSKGKMVMTAWLALLLSGWATAADGPPLFPEGYKDFAALTAEFRQLAAQFPDLVKLESLGKSHEGRDIWLARIEKASSDKSPKPRPTILIVADMEGDHVIGGEVALRLARRLTNVKDESASKTLDKVTILLAPRLNPDGTERLFRNPKQASRANAQTIDRDRDGREGEDGPEDLNGDGIIASMRFKDLDKADLILDKDEARLLRSADVAKNEKATHRELPEGVDNDNDDLFNEDPPSGVMLHRNWPHGWTEFDPETGAAPVSEPETRALIQYVFDHPEIAVVWSFGLNDNVRSESKRPQDRDTPVYAELTQEFSKANVIPASEAKPDAKGADPKDKDKDKDKPPAPAPKPCGDGPVWGAPADGALAEWAYHQFGAVGLATRLWTSPTLAAPADPKAKLPDHGDARWLHWNDKVMGGRAFLPWTEFNHPTLGKVEIGGWRPGVRINPPSTEIDPIADVQWRFLQVLSGRMPSVQIREAKVEAKGGRLFEITAVIENSGQWPTALAQSVQIRQGLPTLVRLKAGSARFLAGNPLERIPRLEGNGGRQKLRWLILSPNEEMNITVEVTHPRVGRDSKSLILKSAN